MKTLGDHIRKQRLDLGFLQKEVALKIGADSQTICNWENNITQPSIHWIPKIIDFLGYAPYSPAKSLGERLSNHRKHLGLPQKQLAMIMGVDPSSVRDWECGIHKPFKKSLEKIKTFLYSKYDSSCMTK